MKIRHLVYQVGIMVFVSYRTLVLKPETFIYVLKKIRKNKTRSVTFLMFISVNQHPIQKKFKE